MAANGSENRRGSSIFAASAASTGDASGPYGRPAYLYGKNDGDLLEEFPEKSKAGRNSSMEMDVSGADTNDDATDLKGGPINVIMTSSNDSASEVKPRRGEAARMEELSNSEDLPGGSKHRPLVGGFAAAAYEAAKAHHYSSKKEPTGGIPKDRVPPPSI
jgi:hypothetical protein